MYTNDNNLLKRATTGLKRYRWLLVMLMLGAIVLLLSGTATAELAGPFNIDGTVPDDPNFINIPDPEGNTKELGPENSNTTKLGVIDDDLLPTLDRTNPNGQVDLADTWVATGNTNGDIWFYFGWLRDANRGSGVISIELGANPPPAACDYTLIGTPDEQTLIDTCNPWANRADGDTLFLWDQQGNNLVIQQRTFDDASDTWGPTTDLDPSIAVAAYSTDGFYGEVAINLTATIFDPNVCESVGNIIPGTITGNSDSADYKDTVLGDTGLSISNCGSIKVVKEDDAGNRLNGVTFDFYQDDGDGVYEPGSDDVLTDSCTTATVNSEEGVCTASNLLVQNDYWVVEDTSTLPFGYDPADPPQQLKTVAVNETTVVTFVNPRQRGSIVVEKVVKGTATRIDGAAFALDGDGDPTTTGDQTPISGVAGETGLFCVDNLLFGTYHVVETTVPAGYAAVTEVQSFAVNTKSDCSDAATRSADLTFENEAQPTLATLATAAATVGDTIFDTATLSGGFNPTGTITFELYLGDNTCSDAGARVFSQEVPVSGNGDYTTNPGHPTAAAGTYYWLVSYSGDGSNAAAGHLCGATGEVTTVAKETPSLATSAVTGVTVGAAISDTATLTGGFNPTGTINFKLYFDDNTCTDGGALVFEQDVAVNGNGIYVSNDYSTDAAGSYFWLVSYSGDANNEPAGHACGADGEVSVVNKAQPALATTPKLLPNDEATISGLFTPASGTIIFELYESADCTGSPLYSEPAQNVTDNGTYSTSNDSVFITADGTYSWLVTYSGDGNNNAAFSACTAERMVIDFQLGE